MTPKVKSDSSPRTDQADSAVDLVFGPLQTFLRMVGLLGPRPDSHVVVRVLLWLHWALTGTILFLGALVKWAVCLPLDNSSQAIVEYSWSIMAYAPFVLMFVHWKIVLEKKLAGILQELRNFERVGGRPCFLKPRVTRRKLFLSLIIYLGVMGTASAFYSILFSGTLKTQNCLVPLFITSITFKVYMSHIVLMAIFSAGLEVGSFSLFVLLCSSTSRMFQALNQKLRARIADSTPVIEEGEMEEFRSNYQRVCRLTRELDNLFGVFVASMLLVALAAYFICIYMVIFENVLSDKLGILVSSLAFGVVISAIILVQSIRIQEQAYSIKETLNGIPSNRMTDRTLTLVSLFCSEVTSDPVGLTVAKTFLLDRGIYVTLFGALLSYTIVLIQSKPATSILTSCALNVAGNVTKNGE